MKATLSDGSSLFTILIAAAAPLIAVPAAAQSTAQSTPAAAAKDVEEIVVTAQFREQNLQQTPIAITAVSGAMLQARSQTNIAQIANQAPNVTLHTGAANFGPSLVASIRGVGQSDFNPAVEPGVGLYVDDVYYATLTGSIFDLLDLDRVEVLRGPQGTLAGRNSIGGAIKLFSKRPTQEDSGAISATYGSRNRLDLRASANFRLSDDFSARIAGVAKRQDGYVKELDFGCANPQGSANNPALGGVATTRPVGQSCVTGHEGNVNYQAVRGQLRYHPDAKLDVNIIADYTNDDRQPTGQVLTYAKNASPVVRGPATAVPYDARFICGKYCNYSSYVMPADAADGFPTSTTRRPQQLFRGGGVSGEIEYNLTDALKLTSITAYRRYSAQFATDDDLSPLYLSSGYSHLKFHFFSEEVRLNGSFLDNRINYTVGGYYNSQKSTYATVQDLRWAGLQFSSLGDPVPAHSKAGFANISWNIIDKLTFNGGIRYTDEDKDYTYSRRYADGSVGQPLVGGLDGITGTYKHDRVDYRANLQYQWAPTFMTYATISTGFKGGGVNPRPYFPSQVQPFGPEKITAYELGAKTDLFDHKARINVSAFYNDYKDIQLTLLSCPQYNPPFFPAGVPGLPCALPANSGDAHVKGIEVETSLRPVAGLLIDGAVSYLDFNYTRIDAAASGPGGVSKAYVAPNTPDWKWSIGVQYAIELGTMGTLTPRVDAAYQAHIFTNAANSPTNRIASYTVANGRITWTNARKDLDISAEVTNMFDKYYLLNSFDLAASAGYASGVPGRPREWALTVSKRF